MGRPRKLSKWQVEIALATTHGNISASARLVKSTRNTVKAAMRFWGLFDRDYGRSRPPIESANCQEESALGPKLLPAPQFDTCPTCGAVFDSPGPRIHNSNCNQFPRRTGSDSKGAIANERPLRPRGDVGRSGNHIASAEELQSRYHKLRNS